MGELPASDEQLFSPVLCSPYSPVYLSLHRLSKLQFSHQNSSVVNAGLDTDHAPSTDDATAAGPSAMAINLPAKLEELLVLFLREDGVRQALDRELILLRQGSWTLESAVAPPTTSSALRSPPVARAATYATPPRRKRSAAGAARLDAVAAAASAGEEEDDVNDPNDLTPDYPPPSTTPPRALAVPCFYQRPENRSTSKLDRLLLEQVREAFDEGDLLLRVEDFELIAKVCGLSTYLAADLFRACGGQGDSGVPISRFTAYWEDLAAQCVTLPEKVMRLLNADGGPLTPAHLRCLVGFVLKTHPGLDFLLESPQYHERYIDTVIARMFYSINRCAPVGLMPMRIGPQSGESWTEDGCKGETVERRRGKGS